MSNNSDYYSLLLIVRFFGIKIVSYKDSGAPELKCFLLPDFFFFKDEFICYSEKRIESCYLVSKYEGFGL
mgnify:CR=1 FL=1